VFFRFKPPIHKCELEERQEERDREIRTAELRGEKGHLSLEDAAVLAKALDAGLQRLPSANQTTSAH
jgi:hypothetical protein